MLREETVFGPIHSRRLGSSLGINLLPTKGKLCNFDCIYCECGWNADGAADRRLPTAAQVRELLEAKLRQCAADCTPIDSITFSGDGEPTLNPEFPQIVRDTVELRNRYFPGAVVSVLTNATRICRQEVAEALHLVDNAILKLDAPTDALAAVINQPRAEYHVESIVGDMERFGHDFVLQTMFLRAPGFDSSNPEVLGPWMDIVRRLRPREVMVYTLDRPAPAEGLQKFTAAEMQALVQPLIDEGIKIQIKG